MDQEQEIWINGEPHRVPAGATVEALLRSLDLGARRVAVAVNRDVIPRSRFSGSVISAGDRIEILEAVGGG